MPIAPAEFDSPCWRIAGYFISSCHKTVPLPLLFQQGKSLLCYPSGLPPAISDIFLLGTQKQMFWKLFKIPEQLVVNEPFPVVLTFFFFFFFSWVVILARYVKIVARSSVFVWINIISAHSWADQTDFINSLSQWKKVWSSFSFFPRVFWAEVWRTLACGKTTVCVFALQ